MAITAAELAQWRTQVRQILKTGQVGSGRRFTDDEIDELLDPGGVPGGTPTLAEVLAEGNAAGAQITTLTSGSSNDHAVNKGQMDTADAAVSSAAILRNGSQAWTANQPVGGFGFTGLAFLSQEGTGLPTSGLVRLAHSVNGTSQIVGRTTANDADVSVLNWGLANNRLVLGAAACERLTLDVGAAGFAEVRTNGTARQSWEATVISASIPWSRGNAASNALQSYPASAQAVATDTDFDTSQTIAQTVTLTAGRQYLFTATATAKDAAGTGGNVLWTRTIFCRYYRKATGGALQLNAGGGDNGGRECHLFEAAGSEADFTFVSAVSTNDVTFTLTNVAGANNLEGDVEITWSEMPLR